MLSRQLHDLVAYRVLLRGIEVLQADCAVQGLFQHRVMIERHTAAIVDWSQTLECL